MSHRSEKSNRVANALSRRKILLIEMQIEVVRFNELKSLYLEDLDFGEASKACIEPVTLDRTKWLYFIIHDGILFRGS